jgi:flagellar biosynthesis/type III secretory pathway protein FliH
LKESYKLRAIPEYFDDTLKKVMKLLEWGDWSETMARKYRKGKHDWSDYSIAFEEQRQKGLTEGIQQGFDQGRTEGFQRGVQQGIERGKAEGKAEGMKEMAQKMLALGEPLEKVLSLTGFSKEELMSGH